MNTAFRRSAALTTLLLACLAGCDCGTCENPPASSASEQPTAPSSPAMPAASAQAGAVPPTTVAAGLPVRFEIKGMHCNGCAEAIAAEAKGVPGVQQVTVSFDDSRADMVVADPAQAQAVEDAIRKLGYTVTRQR